MRKHLALAINFAVLVVIAGGIVTWDHSRLGPSTTLDELRGLCLQAQVSLNSLPKIERKSAPYRCSNATRQEWYDILQTRIIEDKRVGIAPNSREARLLNHSFTCFIRECRHRATQVNGWRSYVAEQIKQGHEVRCRVYVEIADSIDSSRRPKLVAALWQAAKAKDMIDERKALGRFESAVFAGPGSDIISYDVTKLLHSSYDKQYAAKYEQDQHPLYCQGTNHVIQNRDNIMPPDYSAAMSYAEKCQVQAQAALEVAKKRPMSYRQAEHWLKTGNTDIVHRPDSNLVAKR